MGLHKYLPTTTIFTRLGLCFTIDGFSYLAVLFSLLAMHVQLKPSQNKSGAISQFREGWTYAFGSLPIRMLLVNLAIISLMGTPYTVLMPVFAEKVLHGSEGTLGLLTASIGCGVLVGGLKLAAQERTGAGQIGSRSERRSWA